MNGHYLKYTKNNWTTLLTKIDTKEKLNNIRYELKLKSYNDVFEKLIEIYERDKKV